MLLVRSFPHTFVFICCWDAIDENSRCCQAAASIDFLWGTSGSEADGGGSGRRELGGAWSLEGGSFLIWQGLLIPPRSSYRISFYELSAIRESQIQRRCPRSTRDPYPIKNKSGGWYVIKSDSIQHPRKIVRYSDCTRQLKLRIYFYFHFARIKTYLQSHHNLRGKGTIKFHLISH